MAEKDYEVGYGKPPKDSQFKKGQSGNPKGRPRGSRNFKTDLQEEMQLQIQVTESGRPEIISKQRAMIKRAMEKALHGDLRAIELIGKWQGHYGDSLTEIPEIQDMTANDQAIIERFLTAQPQTQPDYGQSAVAPIMDDDKSTES